MNDNNYETHIKLARFFVRELIIKQYGSNYTHNEELINFAAEKLLRRYASTDKPPEKTGSTGQQPSITDQYKSLDAQSSENSIFPLDFNPDVGVGSINIHITNPKHNTYIATTKCKLLGITLDESELKFDDGNLSRSETIGGGPLEFKYSISIDVSNGFHLRFEGDGYVNYYIDTQHFHVGPFDLSP
ncbi:hypothetical protein JYG34_12270 [Pseudomonas entomophila]|uniref:hypothetical protein n=1 Tax=Pseudomonas entomophila TaxID=312306 RepID=UPI001BCD4BF2|nr:hypothetical protein [Pseudomonas entomophila]QVM93741.1 hypothetical protein JYG34_12270 [Pseudomonas entomophila]